MEDAEKFVRNLYDNEDVREELNDALELSDDEEVGPEEIRRRMEDVIPAFASERGFDFTAEEGFEAVDTLSGQGESDELSDRELEQVAGGKSEASNIATSVLTAGIGCAISSIVGAAKDGQTCEGELKGDPTVTQRDR